MICIAITEAAYEAITRTLALGTVACEPQADKSGERLIWLEERRLDNLNSSHPPFFPRPPVLCSTWRG
jgi:hypothetical protein